MALPVGTQLGRYTVLKALASSGLTEVLLARAQGMGGFQHHVVIKAIRANKSTDPAFISAFVDEARLAASLHHHHIVQVHDVGRDENDYFFAMEYVHGENLRALLTRVARANGFVPLDQVITIGIAVASGLHYAHQQDLVHRDVTPANILVGYDGNVKVTDFGIAKALFKSSELTKSGSMRGKVAYMAPEQCLGRPIDRRSDIFSLGIVLYELCTSRRLFKGETDFLVMTSIVNGKVPKPTLQRKDLPIELEDVILKALAPKPELRFSTAEDVAMALERVAVAHGIRISGNALSEYMRKTFGQRPEPWLVDSGFESVDVDFDGGGSGLVELDEKTPLAVPIGEFGEDQRTEIDRDDEDEEPATLTGDTNTPVVAKPATSGFESNEQTLIGEQADVDMLVRMSKIEGRKDATPIPRKDSTPLPRRDATPLPAPRPPTDDPPEEPPTLIEGPSGQPASQPGYHPASGIIQRLQSSPAPWNNTDGAVTGTPMAWVQQDGEVPSLAPRGRRVMLIAAVAVPLVAIGIFVITRNGGGDEPAPASEVEPDAFVEKAPVVIDAAAAHVTPDGAPAIAPDAAAKPAVAKPVIVTPAPPPKKPVVPPPKKPPITKKPPLKK